MTTVTAVLDANVLYPASLRDLLLQLAFSGFYRARWSVQIEDEWKRNLLAARPALADKIERTQAVMRRAIPDALVMNYERRIPKLLLPDEGDRHVLAAAIKAEATLIVTFNIRDFPAAALAPLGLVARHTDAFLQRFTVETPGPFLAAVKQCVARLEQPPVDADLYLNVLLRVGLPDTVSFLRSHVEDWQR